MNDWKNPNFINAFKNSLNGVKSVYKNERNIRIQTVFAVLALIARIFTANIFA